MSIEILPPIGTLYQYNRFGNVIINYLPYVQNCPEWNRTWVEYLFHVLSFPIFNKSYSIVADNESSENGLAIATSWTVTSFSPNIAAQVKCLAWFRAILIHRVLPLTLFVSFIWVGHIVILDHHSFGGLGSFSGVVHRTWIASRSYPIPALVRHCCSRPSTRLIRVRKDLLRLPKEAAIVSWLLLLRVIFTRFWDILGIGLSNSSIRWLRVWRPGQRIRWLSCPGCVHVRSSSRRSHSLRCCDRLKFSVFGSRLCDWRIKKVTVGAATRRLLLNRFLSFLLHLIYLLHKLQRVCSSIDFWFLDVLLSLQILLPSLL